MLVSGLFLIVVVVVAWNYAPRRSDIPHGPAIYAAMSSELAEFVRSEPVRVPSVDGRLPNLDEFVLYTREATRASETQEGVRISEGWEIAIPGDVP